MIVRAITIMSVILSTVVLCKYRCCEFNTDKHQNYIVVTLQRY